MSADYLGQPQVKLNKMNIERGVLCHKCGDILEWTAQGKLPNFCSNCGEIRASNVTKFPMLCPKCGTERSINRAGVPGKFCSECAYQFQFVGDGVPSRSMTTTVVSELVASCKAEPIPSGAEDSQFAGLTRAPGGEGDQSVVGQAWSAGQDDHSAGECGQSAAEGGQSVVEGNLPTNERNLSAGTSGHSYAEGDHSASDGGQSTGEESQLVGGEIPIQAETRHPIQSQLLRSPQGKAGKRSSDTLTEEASNTQADRLPSKAAKVIDFPRQAPVVTTLGTSTNNDCNTTTEMATPAARREKIGYTNSLHGVDTSKHCAQSDKSAFMSSDGEDEEFHDTREHLDELPQTAQLQSNSCLDAGEMTKSETGAKATNDSSTNTVLSSSHQESKVPERNGNTETTKEVGENNKADEIDCLSQSAKKLNLESVDTNPSEKSPQLPKDTATEDMDAAQHSDPIDDQPSSMFGVSSQPEGQLAKGTLKKGPEVDVRDVDEWLDNKGGPAAHTRSRTMVQESSVDATGPTPEMVSSEENPKGYHSDSREEDVILVAFQDLKSKLEEVLVKRAVILRNASDSTSGSQKESINLTNSQKTALDKAPTVLKKRNEQYQEYLKVWNESGTKEKKPQTLTDTINGMRNDFNEFAPQLNSIFTQFNVAQTLVPALDGGRASKKSKKEAKNKQAQGKRGGTKEVEFKAVLSSRIKKLYRKLGKPAVVKIHSNLLQGWDSPLAELKEGENGVWSTTVSLPDGEYMVYKYAIYIDDGPEYEWLDEVFTSYYNRQPWIVDRTLNVSGLDQISCIHDGVIELKSEPEKWSKRLKNFASDVLKGFSGGSEKKSPKEELSDGLKAMLPSWVTCIKERKLTIDELLLLIQQVFSRQWELFTSFSSYYLDSVVLNRVDHQLSEIGSGVLLSYIGEHVTATNDGTFSPEMACASLMGLICLGSSPYTGLSTSNISRFMETVKSTMPKLVELKEPSPSVSPLLSSKPEFLNGLLPHTLKVIAKLQSSGSHKYAWIHFIPLIHIITGVTDISIRGDEYNTPEWWGTAYIGSQVEATKESVPSSGEWNTWYTWLKPFFSSIPMIPYTLLALLTERQLSNLLEKADSNIVGSLPLDGILACVLYHLKRIRSGEEKGKLVDKLFEFGEKKFGIHRNCVSAPTSVNICCGILNQVIGYDSGIELRNPYSLGVFNAIKLTLFVLDTVKAQGCAASFEEGRVSLIQFCKRLLKSFERTFYFTHTTSYPYHGEKLGSLEMKLWKSLFECVFSCTDEGQQQWWNELCQQTLKDRLVKVAERNRMALIDLYCYNDFSIAGMDEIIAEQALSVAEEILEKPSYDVQAFPEKIGKLVNRALDQKWDSKNTDSMGIVRNIVKWGHFRSLWHFFNGLSEEQKKTISPKNLDRLSESSTALNYILKQVVERSMTWADFKYLYQFQEKLADLCVVTDDWKESVELIKQEFHQGHLQQELYLEFIRDLDQLWGSCRDYVEAAGNVAINQWFERDVDNMEFSQVVDVGTSFVIGDCISEKTRAVLNEFSKLQERRLFFELFQNNLRLEQPVATMDAVSDIHSATLLEYRNYVDQFECGSVSLGQLEKIVKKFFGNNLNSLRGELGHMLSNQVLSRRRKQIELCTQLEQYQEGARTMLGLRDLYSLRGDFTDMEKVQNSRDKQLQLKDISQGLIDSAERIKNISDPQLNCLKAFKKCNEFIEWVNKEVKEKDISNFVDLASSTLGEDDMAALKTRSLLNALTGYSPLIYHLNDSMNYESFMELCKKVWRSLDENKELVKNLTSSARELEWLKKVKDHFGNVEIHSIDQATAINNTGIYKVGCFLDSKQKQFKTVADVLQLTCKVEEVKGKGDDGKVITETTTKQYSHAELRDLQSKLALVAGDKQKEMQETILRFNALKDAAENIAQAYLDIRREGCIQFDELLVIIHCNPEDTFALELNLQSIRTVISARNDANANVLRHCKDLYTYLKECIAQWQSSLETKRRELPVLNFYTTEQLVVLRKELGSYFDSKESGSLQQSLPLLAMVHPVNPQLLHQYISGFNPADDEVEVGDAENMEVDRKSKFIPYEDMDDEHKDLITELLEEDEEFDLQLAVQAVNELGLATQGEFSKWIENYQETQSKHVEEARARGTNVLQTATELMSELMVQGSIETSLQKKLATLWDGFIEHTSRSIKDFLSIPHLAYVLTQLKGTKTKHQLRRRLPEWLDRGRPRLLAIPEKHTYQMVLTIYECEDNPSFGYPTRNEVLICNKLTRVEEVSLFLNRALNDPLSFYCMVNCHLLDYEVCRVIENRLSNTADDTVKDFGLAFIYAEEAREARIRSYLDKNLVKNFRLTPLDQLAKFVQKILELPASVKKSACTVDPDRSLSRLIRSGRAGVGKSLQRFNLCTKLRNKTKGKDITLPIYKTINTNSIIERLTQELGNGFQSNLFHTIHLDIAHEVTSGVDELLFNLIILRSIVNSEGVVWQAQNTQYYIIECMPYTRKDGSCQHEVMDLLPTRKCLTPGEALVKYQNKEKGFIGFDERVLRQAEWQIVLKYLHCHSRDDERYAISNEHFTSHIDALQLLIRNCGLRDPTWSELRHYVYFLSNQLVKVGMSPFCGEHSLEDLPGFRSLVIKFMIVMAQDFATRSLKIAEDTPGLQLGQIEEDDEGDNILDQLGMKRTWESGNHPYLFFNEDGATFTPLGFFVQATEGAYSLLDGQTNQVLFRNCMSQNLKRALDQYRLSMSENFNSLNRLQKLTKLRDIMVKKIIYRTEVTQEDGNSHYTEHPLFDDSDDPDPNYVLTMDNTKKILAIHQRLRVDIPVIIMGETGCGKTKLIDFMSKLQVPTALKDQINTMIIVKIHGGTTEEDIIAKVEQAQKLARRNQKKCKAHAKAFDSIQVPTVYTILFLDEANTTEAIGLVKEILCDGRMRGKPLEKDSGLKIIAACNPYRRHTDAMIEKLKRAGLGYTVSESETTDRFGQIPMRHLVYRVQALSQSLLPLVWDFGTLRSAPPLPNGEPQPGDVETAYIRQMIVKFNTTNMDAERPGAHFAQNTSRVAQILSMTQAFMREQKDECSFVSLRDIQRLLDVTNWFYSQREHIFYAIDGVEREDNSSDEEDEEEEEAILVRNVHKDYTMRSLILALGVCYIARLEEPTRETYINYIALRVEELIAMPDIDGQEFITSEIERCQDMFINQVVNTELHKNIAKNKALKENVFMMIVCIENRIPLFLVGKPGSSKSLSKSLIVDAMKGNGSHSPVLRHMKRTYMVSFQCSRYATPAGIVGVFNHCANFQKGQDLDTFVSVVVLDEVGLAEDSENMPLKTLHPLLEDGCGDSNKIPEPYMKCAFVGISNWALDPAKMNRGIFVQRGTPHPNELEQIAREICGKSSKNVTNYIEPLAKGYLQICEAQKPEERDLTEFYGLRDFYSLIKMVTNFAANSNGTINRNQLEHSIRRNFGGFDTDSFDPMKIFRKHCSTLDNLRHQDDGRPPIDSIGLIQSSLSGQDTQAPGMESRYLLILTENLSVLSIILDEFAQHDQQPEVVFGSKFRDDVSYTQVCHNIYRIKTCMDMGKPVILLNLDDLYESLYDALNQYFSTWGDRKFVDIGLGTHRVKTFVDERFRLVVIADKNKVHSQFPIPLINRLEKHYVSATSLLTEEQKQVKAELEKWAKKFITPTPLYRNACPAQCQGCETELNQPYRLPCQHFIGQCCREAMFSAANDDDQQCPVPGCNQVLDTEYSWTVDRAALDNRQYFENCTTENAFIGYSTETAAIAVRQASADVESGQYRPQQVLERAKFYMLQCATGEAVLRLDKTFLAAEARQIQEVFMTHQYHETLLQYLSNEVDLNEPTTFYIQVTSFAELMGKEDMRILSRGLNEGGKCVEVHSRFLKDFAKEDQFTEYIRSVYEATTSFDCKLLLIQCELANENTELLDSVRFIIQRESETAHILQEVFTHTVLLLNVPRGRTFTGSQGGKWRCVHIDDPKSPDICLPSLNECLHLKPSQILGHLLRPVNGTAVKGINEPTFLENTGIPMDTNGEVVPDQDMDQSEDGPDVQIDSGLVEDLRRFVIQCLPSAVSHIKADKQYDRLTYLKQLLDQHEEFTKLFLRHTHSLLQCQDENNPSSANWVKYDAAKASNMKESETLRHALEDALERAFVPALAAVISFIDVRQNLLILSDNNSKLRGLWLQIFDQCHKLGLSFEQLTRNADTTNADIRSKLPRSYKIHSAGHGSQEFRVNLPFSWIIKDTIDRLLVPTKQLDGHIDGKITAVIGQFSMTSIGSMLIDARFNQFRGELLDAYMKDCVYMCHPCLNKDEHWIVGYSMMKWMESNWPGDSLTFVHVNLAYNELKPMFQRLSSVLALSDDVTALARYVQEQTKTSETKKVAPRPCDLLALEYLLDSFKSTELDNLLTFPEQWVSKVDMCGQVVWQVIEAYNNTDHGTELGCKESWLKIEVKKLYVEHVIIPSPKDPVKGKRKPFKITFFIKNITRVDFYNLEAFNQVVMSLSETVSQGVRSLYKHCPTQCPMCTRTLDSPVRLPCQHIVCDTCVREIALCKECGKQIPEGFHYNPAQDNIDEDKLRAFKDLRKRLNTFFMTFVSNMVFNGDEDPVEEIIRWLVDCVTGRDGETTRQFSLFNSAEVVDPTPVIRSFLLKLLLQCSQTDTVNSYLNDILRYGPATGDHQLQTMVLFMDCWKDLHAAEFRSDPKELSDRLQRYTRDLPRLEVTAVSVDVLIHLANVHTVISLVMDLLTSSNNIPIQSLERTLHTFISEMHKSGNRQAWYLIARQLLATHGETYIKDLLNTHRRFLIHDDLKRDLESFTVPDVLSVYGGQAYGQIKAAIDDIIANSDNDDQLTNAVNSFRQLCTGRVELSLQVLFNRVTRTFTQRVPVPHHIPTLLYNQFGPALNQQQATLLEMLLQDGRLPREMDVNQSSGINLSMLVLNLYSCLCSGGVMADLYPLSEIINQPDQAARSFLPTMVDNQFEAHREEIRQALQTPNENPTAYKCPNGHPYIIGNCGQPNALAVCPECRAQIGGHAAQGQNRRLDPNDPAARSQPGHILGAPTRRMAAAPERDLDPLSCSVLRCLTHLCMYVATLFNMHQVYGMINPRLPRVEDVCPFLEAHIQLDLQQISQCCTESTDDSILLIHDVISRMKQAARQGANQMLTSIQLRRQWERGVDVAYIRPTFSNKTQRIEAIRESLRGADTVDLRRLLSTSERPFNDTNLLASAGLWGYRRPLTLVAVQNLLISVKDCTNLKNLVGFCDVLTAVQHLPNVLKLLKTLSDKFHGELSRHKAKQLRIGDFCRRQEKDIPNLRVMVDSFISAWNSMVAYFQQAGNDSVPDEMNTECSLAEFLVDQYAARRKGERKVIGDAPCELIRFLVDVNNRMLVGEIVDRQTGTSNRPPIKLSGVRSATIVSLSNHDELLNLILAHSEYELRETTAITYNWPAIEREVLHRYISNKPRIEFSRDQLPCYVYQEDFNLHNQMQAISDSQERLSEEMQESITNTLPQRVPVLTAYLRELKVIINFLSVTPYDQGEQSLGEYMTATFGKEPEYISNEIKVKHVKHVWLLVKYAQTDLLMRQHQEPFDDLSPEYRDDLNHASAAELNDHFRFNSPRTKKFLLQLFEFIVLGLNKAAMAQEVENPERSIDEAIKNYIMNSVPDEIEAYQLLQDLPPLAQMLTVKHASRMWAYIWIRYTAKPV